MIQQVELRLPAYTRGYHLITTAVLQELPPLPQQGLLSLFIKHTSAALTINENADPSVRDDFESIVNHIVPENLPFLTHTLEGPDDMPAHIKSSIMGCEVTIPVQQGKLQLGTWQGITLGEHRNQGGARRIVATLQGLVR